MKTRKIISLIIIAILLIVSDCVTIKKIDFMHDHNNPCSPGEFENAIECEHWKKSFPKEYKKYKERLKEDSIYWLIN